MNYRNSLQSKWSRAIGFSFIFVLLFSALNVEAAPWKGINPGKSRRVDVERALGQPLTAEPGESGKLTFNVDGTLVTVTFFTPTVIQEADYSPRMQGRVREIIVHFQKSNETPESMRLKDNSKFKRAEQQSAIIFTNLKDGIIHTFINGRLSTSRFIPSSYQWARAR